ncbi:hypothetical protein ABQE93_22965 [Mycolicibacterium sp. XJ662]
MTSLTTNSDLSATLSTRSAPAQAPVDEPVLITEQQVLWGTAVARSAKPPAKQKKQKPARRQYPKRHAWLENSLMSREMDRL